MGVRRHENGTMAAGRPCRWSVDNRDGINDSLKAFAFSPGLIQRRGKHWIDCHNHSRFLYVDRYVSAMKESFERGFAQLIAAKKATQPWETGTHASKSTVNMRDKRFSYGKGNLWRSYSERTGRKFSRGKARRSLIARQKTSVRDRSSRYFSNKQVSLVYNLNLVNTLNWHRTF